MTTSPVIDPFISIGGTDYSDHLEGIRFKIAGENIEYTNAGSSGWKEHKKGLKSGEVQLKLQQDMGNGDLTQDLWSKVLAGSPVTLVFAMSGSTASTSNPKYTISALPPDLEIGGDVGTKGLHDTTWTMTGAPSVDDGT